MEQLVFAAFSDLIDAIFFHLGCFGFGEDVYDIRRSYH